MRPIQDKLSADIFRLFNSVEPDVSDEFTYDFLGVRTSTSYNSNWSNTGGVVKPKPRKSWEWISLLWAVATAGEAVTLIECGAGWGPWIARGYAAAQQRGIEKIRVIGIEGEPRRFEFLKSHMANNGVTEDEALLINGVVSPKSGIALFPNATRPEEGWGIRQLGQEGTNLEKMLDQIGAEAIAGEENLYTVGKRPGTFSMQRSVSLTDLIEPYEVVDFIHLDIQGSEGKVIQAAIESLNQKCRIMYVGTHSHEIEADLRKLLPDNAWTLVHDIPMSKRNDGRLKDGTQVWVNNTFM